MERYPRARASLRSLAVLHLLYPVPYMMFWICFPETVDSRLIHSNPPKTRHAAIVEHSKHFLGRSAHIFLGTQIRAVKLARMSRFKVSRRLCLESREENRAIKIVHHHCREESSTQNDNVLPAIPARPRRRRLGTGRRPVSADFPNAHFAATATAAAAFIQTTGEHVCARWPTFLSSAAVLSAGISSPAARLWRTGRISTVCPGRVWISAAGRVWRRRV